MSYVQGSICVASQRSWHKMNQIVSELKGKLDHNQNFILGQYQSTPVHSMWVVHPLPSVNKDT